ncbi:MAG: hypothetical protein IT373_00910 [Polyangiaceae bacterium]|nr:hypothetical protein [Polyangiaceae bacterium]
MARAADGADQRVAQAGPVPPRPDPPPVAVRVALSRAAGEKLNEVRVLRLVGIELDPSMPLAASPNGPLEGDFIQVWIDLPGAGRAAIQVRRSGHGLVERTLGLDGYAPDVAARFVAIATAEMVRRVARPDETATPVEPNGPDGAAGAGAARTSRVAVSASLGVTGLPAAGPGVLFGPGLGVEYKLGIVGTSLAGRWLSALGEPGARWLEVGVASAAHVPMAPGWRFVIGGAASAVALRLPAALTIDGASGQFDWTARIAAVVGVEAELAEGTWIGATLEPGACLRALEVVEADRSYALGGFAFHGGLALRAEL